MIDFLGAKKVNSLFFSVIQGNSVFFWDPPPKKKKKVLYWNRMK